MRTTIIVAGLLLGVPVARGDDWLDGEDATGNWGGARPWLDERGVQPELDYTAESFALPTGDQVEFRGNLDLLLTLDSEKLGLWPGGELLVYGQHAHGSGVSEHVGLVMPVSNLEAPEFTQLSELWLEQRLGGFVRLRLGKQDANRDFAAPRFAGNFVNSSFGAIPTVPMPTFPTPGLGGVLFIEPTTWLGFRAGVYEGAPELERLTGDLSTETGALGMAEIVVEHRRSARPFGIHRLGTWHHSGTGESGVFGVLDLLVLVAPEVAADPRSVQVFARGGWTPGPAELPELHAGGGVTAHGFLGANNTLGLGAGWVRTLGTDEAFVELFFKLRTIPWLTIEPDAQVYFTPDGMELVVGLRSKLKL